MTDLTALADTASLMLADHREDCPDAPFWAVQRFRLAGDPAVAVRLAEVYLTGGREVVA